MAACWSLLIAFMSNKAKKSHHQLDHHATQWCEQYLKQAMLNLEQRRSLPMRLSASMVQDAIEVLKSSIGDTQQASPSEDRYVDALLRRS